MNATPTEADTDTMSDPLSAARGVGNGILYALAFWLVVAAAVWSAVT